MIFSEGLCPEGNIITEGNVSTNPPSGGSINDTLYRKLKNPLLKFRMNFKTIKRIQFLFSYLYLCFWRFLLKIFEHVLFGSLKVTYSTSWNLWLNQSIFCTKLQTTARERHIVSKRGVHARAWDTIISHCGSTFGYYSISRCIATS
jgi:hypothetical protein